MKKRDRNTSQAVVAPMNALAPTEPLPLFGRLDLLRLVEVTDELENQLEASGLDGNGVIRTSSERPLRLFDAPVALIVTDKTPVPPLLCVPRTKKFRPGGPHHAADRRTDADGSDVDDDSS